MVVNRHSGEYDALAKNGISHSHKDIELVCVLARCAGPDALVIDVGACFGAFTLALARVLAETNSRVLSFEPQRWLYHCLCGTLALNDLTNVEARHAAVGDSNGWCTILAPDYTKQAHFGSMPVKDFATAVSLEDFEGESVAENEYQVPMVWLDSLRVSPTLIKIDVEGMELRVLTGAEETISRSRPVLYVEHLKVEGGDKAIMAWMEARDYVPYINGADVVGLPREKRHRFPQITYEEKAA